LTPVHDCSDPIHDKILDSLAYKEIAFSAGSGTPLIDVRNFLGVGASECSAYYGSDQVHPNAFGQKYISKYIAGELARIITKP
jgi:lysophospholipase L1-like esterase